MDIENLKLIINTLNSLGANTKESFIWWLVLTTGPTYIFGLIWSCTAIYIVKIISRIIIYSQASHKLMLAAGVSDYFLSTELERACKTLQLHYKDTQL